MSLFGTNEKEIHIGEASITIRRLSRKQLREIERLRQETPADVDDLALQWGIVRWSIDKPIEPASFAEMDPAENYALVMGIMRFTSVLEVPEKETAAPSPGTADEGAGAV